MPATYAKLGIEFNYPENWELSQDDDPSLPRSISVHSPTGAFWSVTQHGPDESPEEIARHMADAIRGEYEDAEMEQYAGNLVHRPVRVGYEIYFYCFDLLIVARVFVVQTEQFLFSFVYQGESRDFEELSPVFDAIAHNLLENQ